MWLKTIVSHAVYYKTCWIVVISGINLVLIYLTLNCVSLWSS